MEEAEKDKLFNRTAAEFIAYIKKHNLHSLLGDLVEQCFLSDAEDPKQFIIEYLIRSRALETRCEEVREEFHQIVSEGAGPSSAQRQTQSPGLVQSESMSRVSCRSTDEEEASGESSVKENHLNNMAQSKLREFRANFFERDQERFKRKQIDNKTVSQQFLVESSDEEEYGTTLSQDFLNEESKKVVLSQRPPEADKSFSQVSSRPSTISQQDEFIKFYTTANNAPTSGSSTGLEKSTRASLEGLLRNYQLAATSDKDSDASGTQRRSSCIQKSQSNESSEKESETAAFLESECKPKQQLRIMRFLQNDSDSESDSSVLQSDNFLSHGEDSKLRKDFSRSSHTFLKSSKENCHSSDDGKVASAKNMVETDNKLRKKLKLRTAECAPELSDFDDSDCSDSKEPSVLRHEEHNSKVRLMTFKPLETVKVSYSSMSEDDTEDHSVIKPPRLMVFDPNDMKSSTSSCPSTSQGSKTRSKVARKHLSCSKSSESDSNALLASGDQSCQSTDGRLLNKKSSEANLKTRARSRRMTFHKEMKQFSSVIFGLISPKLPPKQTTTSTVTRSASKTLHSKPVAPKVEAPKQLYWSLRQRTLKKRRTKNGDALPEKKWKGTKSASEIWNRQPKMNS